jgi:hypothetical protein
MHVVAFDWPLSCTSAFPVLGRRREEGCSQAGCARVVVRRKETAGALARDSTAWLRIQSFSPARVRPGAQPPSAPSSVIPGSHPTQPNPLCFLVGSWHCPLQEDAGGALSDRTALWLHLHRSGGCAQVAGKTSRRYHRNLHVSIACMGCLKDAPVGQGVLCGPSLSTVQTVWGIRRGGRSVVRVAPDQRLLKKLNPVSPPLRAWRG